VTYRPTARQRLGKHISAEAYELNNMTSISRQRICKQAFSTIQTLWFLRGPCREVIKGQRMLFEWVVENSVEFWRWQSKKYGKKKIRLRKEDFMCDLNWQWDGYESVARIRLVKTENPSACVTANSKSVKISDSSELPVVPSCEYTRKVQ
jgi:hypothetical protein